MLCSPYLRAARVAPCTPRDPLSATDSDYLEYITLRNSHVLPTALMRCAIHEFAKQIVRARDARNISRRESRGPRGDREQAWERPWKTARFTAKIIPRRVRGRAGKTHASIRPAWSKKESTYAPARRRTGRETCFSEKQVHISWRASGDSRQRASTPRLFSLKGSIKAGSREAIIEAPIRLALSAFLSLFFSLSLSLFLLSVSFSDATSRSLSVIA